MPTSPAPFRSARIILRAVFITLVLLFAGHSHVRAQSLNVSGVTNKSAYNTSVTFTVQTQAGFDYLALLNDSPVPAGAPVTVSQIDYHELRVYRTNQSTLAVTNRLIQFIVRAPDRNGSEDGLPPWTPYPMIPSSSNELAGASLRLLAPLSFPAGYEIPVVWRIVDDTGKTIRANGSVAASGQNSIIVRRGVGSGFLSATNAPGTLQYSAALRQLSGERLLTLESNVVWTSVGGTLNGLTVWPANSRVTVTNNLTIPSGSSLVIEPGVVVRLSAGVDINLNGQLSINGTTNEPVVFMPFNRTQPWGGFMLTANSSQLTGTGAIFTGSGAVQNWFGVNGRPDSHRKEQALFYCSNSPAITLTDSAAIYLSGQLGHAFNGGTLTFTRLLMQRTTTGGEFTGASFRVNDSAFIECPDDSGNFVDGDNDGLYIVDGTHGFTNTLFGWVKDDAIDSGGGGSGLLNFQNCWFEGAFHEGNSLSANGKVVNHFDGVFINNGQGLEAGYSGPIGTLARCVVTGNLVGGRFGDNYLSQSYSGFLRATNSILIFNYRDVWGMNWQDWTYRTSAMSVFSNFFTVPNPFHPSNTIWQPSIDGWRLASVMTTPPHAPVGIGIALRQLQPSIDVISNGVPVRLSSFTTNTVFVNYQAQFDNAPPVSGSLAFEPGETVKHIPLPPMPSANLARVRILDPVHAEITGNETVLFVRGAAGNSPSLISTGSIWRYLDTGENAGTAWRDIDFDDSAWLSGAAELGYGDNDEATLIRSNGVAGRIITTYFRRAFSIGNPAEYSGLTVHLRRDDGGVVYLNGTEVFRSNMTNALSIPITYTNFAGGSIGSETAFFSTNVVSSLLIPGTNVVAVEIHQNSLTSTDVSFELRLDAELRPSLQHARFGSDTLLFWPDPEAALEEASSIHGPWSDANPSTSPFTVPFAEGQRFYRLKW